MQLKEEGDVYEDVDEDTYQEMLKKRREDDFIEDDGGRCVCHTGAADVGGDEESV